MDDQKLETQLNLALSVNENVRERTLDLNVGFNEALQLWEVIVKYNGDIMGVAEELGIGAEPLTNGYAILTVPQGLINVLTDYPEIEFVEKPNQLFFNLESSRRAACVPPVQEPPFNLKGEGVIIAVIDSGIDYAHPDFRNEDGSTRIVELWDQTISGNPPEGYLLGSVYSREQINEALSFNTLTEQLRIVPSVDLSGHGTHVAGIAGGNGRASNGRYVGIAPACEFLIVKLGMPEAETFPRTTELMRAISYVIQKARDLGRPVAVNLSFGNNYGSHDGSSLLETYIDSMSDVWKTVICIGSGNEGAAGHHTSGILKEGEPRSIEIAVANTERALNIQIWKAYYDDFDITIIGPGTVEVGPLTRRLGTQRFIIGRTEIFVYYGEPKPFNSSQEIYIELVPLGDFIDGGVWRIRLNPNYIVVGAYNLWLPTREEIREQTRFLQPVSLTTLTIPSTASKAITVGAYNSLTNSVADFSGRGFTRMVQFIKPDIAAPGVDIVAPAPGGGYDSKTGTSMATPFVTGASALLMEWGIVRDEDPFLYGEKVKAYLIDGAEKPAIRSVYPNPELGYGTLCLEESFNRAIFVTEVKAPQAVGPNKEAFSFYLPTYIKGYEVPVFDLELPMMSEEKKQLIRPLMVVGYYSDSKGDVADFETHNLNEDDIQEEKEEYVIETLNLSKWFNEFLWELEDKSSRIYVLDIDYCLMHPLDLSRWLDVVNRKLKALKSVLIINNQLLKRGYWMTFCSRERYKKLSIEVHTPMPRLNLYFYGYALDDYCFKLTSPEGEEVDLKHLNQWKEDKNYLEKTDTTLLAKKSQINKLSPFLVELDLINISEGEWELLIEGKVIVDGRIYLMTNLEEKEFTIKHLKKKAFEHTLGNAIIPVDGKDSQMAEDGKAIYYPVLDQMEIEDEKSINVSRVATFMLGLELARNEQLLGFKEAHAYYQKKR